MDAQTLVIETGDLFTIKHDGTTSHIAGITTGAGHDVCSAVTRNKSMATGHSFDQLADALAEMDALHKIPCRVCRVAALIILNRP